MKFRNFGQASLALMATLAVTIGATSCKQNYTVGYLYTTGVQTGTTTGQIGAFKVNSTNGALFTIPGQPFGSGGSNPIRSVVDSTGRYLYVLNQGTATTDNGTTSYTGNNVSVFSVGGDGTLAFQQTYNSSGVDSQRAVEYAGSFLYVLDEYIPTAPTAGAAPVTSSATYSASFPCLGSDNLYHPVGGVTAFTVDSTEGRLYLIQNVQQGGITYFPVGCFPVDFHIAGAQLYTMDAGSTTNNDIETIYPYTINTSTGTLTETTNAPITTGATGVTFIGGDSAGKFVYLLDAGTATVPQNRIFAYTPGTNGGLNAVSGSPYANDPNVADPDALMVDSKTQFVYVANAKATASLSSSNGEISFFTINPTSSVLAEDAGSPISTGSGPDCILEDPTSQYIYTSDYNSGTVTGHLFDPNTGVLTDLRTNSTYTTVGNPTWCVIDSHTD